MAKSSLVAQQKMDEDSAFNSAKVITARFYAEHIMPRASAYAKAAMSGSESTMALPDEQF